MIYDRHNLPSRSHFVEYERICTTPMVKMFAPFMVQTPHGLVEGKAGDYLALDASGNPYPIAAEEHAKLYQVAIPKLKPIPKHPR